MHVYDRTLAASGGVAKANQSSGRLRRSMAPDLSPDCVFLQKTLHGREIDPLAAPLPQESTFSIYHSSFRSESDRWRKPRRG
jgi:hypothetical protein